MKTCLIQPRLEYFIVSSLIFLLTGGVTSLRATINRHEGSDKVFEGTRINFTGYIVSPAETEPVGISFFIKPVNETSEERICNMFFDVCNDTFEYKCYCSQKNGDTYYFVMNIVAKLEYSEATINANIGGTVKYPIVIAQTTTTSTTTTTVPTTTTTVTTTTTTTTSITTTNTTTRGITKDITERAGRSFIATRELSKTDVIVIVVCSVGILALIGMMPCFLFMYRIDPQE